VRRERAASSESSYPRPTDSEPLHAPRHPRPGRPHGASRIRQGRRSIRTPGHGRTPGGVGSCCGADTGSRGWRHRVGRRPPSVSRWVRRRRARRSHRSEDHARRHAAITDQTLPVLAEGYRGTKHCPLKGTVATARGNPRVSPRPNSLGLNPLKAETRVRISLEPPPQSRGVSAVSPRVPGRGRRPRKLAKYPRITPEMASKWQASSGMRCGPQLRPARERDRDAVGSSSQRRESRVARDWPDSPTSARWPLPTTLRPADREPAGDRGRPKQMRAAHDSRYRATATQTPTVCSRSPRKASSSWIMRLGS
jgi:hypothetical protein